MTKKELADRTSAIDGVIRVVGPLYVCCVYPPYALNSDGTPKGDYSPWFVAHCDETALDTIPELAAGFAPPTDDEPEPHADFDAFVSYLEDRGFVILNTPGDEGDCMVCLTAEDAPWAA